MKIEMQTRRRDFQDAVKRVNHAAGKNEPRTYLNSIRFEIYPLIKRIDLTATNGRVVAQSEMHLKGKKFTPEISHSKTFFEVVPVHFFRCIDAVLANCGIDDLIFIEIDTEGASVMEVGSSGYWTRCVLRERSYPNIKEISEEMINPVDFPSDDVLKIITDIMKDSQFKFTQPGAGKVIFDWQKKGCHITVQDRKDAERKADWYAEGSSLKTDPITFEVDLVYFLNALKAHQKVTGTQISFTKTRSGMMLSTPHAYNRQLVMLLKSND